MFSENVFYTFVQIMHNFGACAVVGGSLLVSWPSRQESKTLQKLAWLVLIGWVVQGMSGAGFGITSYIFHGKFPEISVVARGALLIKVFCTMVGIVLTMAYLKNISAMNVIQTDRRWKWISLYASIALIAAAFLRWFA